MLAQTRGRGRPKGSSTRDRMDTARLDLHDTADTLRRLDAELVQARRLVREAWTAAAAAAQVLGTDEHLPACEQAASLAVAS